MTAAAGRVHRRHGHEERPAACGLSVSRVRVATGCRGRAAGPNTTRWARAASPRMRPLHFANESCRERLVQCARSRRPTTTGPHACDDEASLLAHAFSGIQVYGQLSAHDSFGTLRSCRFGPTAPKRSVRALSPRGAHRPAEHGADAPPRLQKRLSGSCPRRPTHVASGPSTLPLRAWSWRGSLRRRYRFPCEATIASTLPFQA